MAVTSVSPDTCTGTWLSLVPPLPSSPKRPYPHAHTVPSARSAYPFVAPAAIAVTPVNPDTCTWTGLPVLQLVSPN